MVLMKNELNSTKRYTKTTPHSNVLFELQRKIDAREAYKWYKIPQIVHDDIFTFG